MQRTPARLDSSSWHRPRRWRLCSDLVAEKIQWAYRGQRRGLIMSEGVGTANKAAGRCGGLRVRGPEHGSIPLFRLLAANHGTRHPHGHGPSDGIDWQVGEEIQGQDSPNGKQFPIRSFNVTHMIQLVRDILAYHRFSTGYRCTGLRP